MRGMGRRERFKQNNSYILSPSHPPPVALSRPLSQYFVMTGRQLLGKCTSGVTVSGQIGLSSVTAVDTSGVVAADTSGVIAADTSGVTATGTSNITNTSQYTKLIFLS